MSENTHFGTHCYLGSILVYTQMDFSVMICFKTRLIIVIFFMNDLIVEAITNHMKDHAFRVVRRSNFRSRVVQRRARQAIHLLPAQMATSPDADRPARPLANANN